jgi:hypothetical protein
MAHRISRAAFRASGSMAGDCDSGAKRGGGGGGGAAGGRQAGRYAAP